MKLKTSIFLWVNFAALLPLALLVFGVTAYSENRYQAEVAQQISLNLTNLVSEIKRRLYYDNQVVLSLASAQSMLEYLPVLNAMNEGKRHHQYFQRSQRLVDFLSSFQSVVPGFRTLRILTRDNKTLIKITRGKTVIGVQDGIESSPFVDEDTGGETYRRRLAGLPDKEVSFLLLPQSKWDWEDPRGPPMLSAVVPLSLRQQRVGYLVVDFNGQSIDRILEVAPRAHSGSLVVAEINPDNKRRNGLILYDDLQGQRFSKPGASSMSLQVIDGGILWEAVQSKPDGNFISADGLYRTFYLEYEPYANRLVSWLVAVRINLSEVRAPFNRIRLGIIVLTLIALIVSFSLARLGAVQISWPIIKMSKTLKEYADGNHEARVQVKGAEEIQRLESAFNYMADKVDKAQHMMLQSDKLASIGQMAAGIGHEINNPLNNILSLTKLMLRSVPADDERLRKDLLSLQEEGKRASEIINGVLNFARQVKPQYSAFEVGPWVEETMRLVRQAAREKNIKLCFKLAQPIVLNGDRNQLQQVLVNLLLNAIQASTRDAEIRIEVVVEPQDLLLRVVDQGSGIRETDMPKIYDPFFTTKEEGQGTGLGLSISLGIVEQHGGKLWLENNENSGVSACVRLPLQQRT